MTLLNNKIITLTIKIIKNSEVQQILNEVVLKASSTKAENLPN